MRWSIAELDAKWADLPPAPREIGRVAQVCVRPEVDQRAFPGAVELSAKRGVIGDRWERRTWMHLADGRPDPRVQVAMIEARVLRWLQALTGCVHHPGDTLVVDFDLSATQLPMGARLCAGDAVLEISDVENDACGKFARHYGEDVMQWIRAPANRERRLRGAFARVVRGGWIREGDAIAVSR